MGQLPFEIWLFIRRLWWFPCHLYNFWKLPRFKEGDLYLDCGWHPVVCTEVTWTCWRWLGPYDRDLAGVSLLDGSSPRSCSVIHCDPQKLTGPVAAHIVSLMLEGDQSLGVSLERRKVGEKHIQNIIKQSPELQKLWG
jgi:hypothetical protein